MNERLSTTTERSDRKGYPKTRLVLPPTALEADRYGRIEIPDGPWTMSNDDLPTKEDAEAYRNAGYRVDTKNRPIHPYAESMLFEPSIGAVTGKGDYYFFGPNYTADAVVITKEERARVLMGLRTDNDKWAIPGGFIDPGEDDPLISASRELYEETGLYFDVHGELFYRGPVDDDRATVHAWPETSAYTFVVEEPVPAHVVDPTEIKELQWFYTDELPKDIHGSHKALIELAEKSLKQPHETTIQEILAREDSLEKTIIDAGHMAYDHYFLSNGSDHLFVKEHDASRFTDDFREAHSRAYLQKEYDLFDYLKKQGFTAIPSRFDLLDDSKMLVMDALTTDDGWVWGDPDKKDADKYIGDILTAFNELQEIPIIPSPHYHVAINPTFETYWAEGWDDISSKNAELITKRIEDLSVGWTDAQRTYAYELIADLPYLRDLSTNISRTPKLFMAHNDARQSNIAWHPEHGVGIVDWSWGDPAPENADATMFLIDMVKSGYDVSQFREYVNKEYLVLYIGFLLAHCIWNTRDGSTTVREQQIASASAAHRLLVSLSE